MEDELLDNKLKNIILILQQQKRTQHQIKTLEEMTQDDGKDFVHKRCCALMGYEYFQKGDAAFHIDTFGDKFYIILKGTVGVYIKIDKGNDAKESNNEDKAEKKKESKKHNADKNEKKPQLELTCVKELKDGMSFGELALLQNKKRLASIICHSNCHVAILDKQSFVQVLGESEEQKILNEMQFFADFPFFEGWNFNLLKLLYLNSYLKSYSKGQYVFKEGTESSAVFFIKSGEFEMFKQFNYDNVMQAGEEPLTALDIGGDKNSNNKLFMNNQSPTLKNEKSKSPNKNSDAQPDQIVEKSRKKKSMAGANEKGKAITFKDPLGKTIKLCILTEKELFGEEDIIEGRRRSFGVRCVSFHGELIMIKQRDFQYRILNDYRTKQLIYQRLEQKKEMMERKVNQLEKSMNLFSDYYFPKSNVINTINASTIPLFRKSFQNSKFQMSDKTFFYTQNINNKETTQPQLQQQQSQIPQLNTAQKLVSQKSQKFDNLNSPSMIKDQPDMKSSQSTKNLTRAATIYNIQKSQESSTKLPMTPGQKLLSQRSILLKSNDQDESNGIENFQLDSPSRSSNLIQFGKGLSFKKNKSIQLQYISNKNGYDSDNLQSPMISSKPTQDVQYLGLVSPIIRNKKESQTFKYDSPLMLPLKPSIRMDESIERSEITKNVSFRLIPNLPKQEEELDLIENDFSESSRTIDMSQNSTPKKQLKFINNQDSLDEIIDQSVSYKEQFLANSPNNQNTCNTIQSDQSKSQTKKEKKDDKQYITNDMTEGFYKNLRVNYLMKFKNQNVQNLKKHIQSSMIDSMPDKFAPLENSDLKKKRKKREPKFQFEDNNFLNWFKQSIKDQDKAFKENRSRSQTSKERESLQNNSQYINQSTEKDKSPTLVLNDEDNVNNSFHNNNLQRIHGQDLQTRYSVVLHNRKKLSQSQDLVIDTDLITENEPASSKLISDSGNNTPMKKNNSFTILRNITKPSNFTSRTTRANNAMQNMFSNDNSPTAAQLLPLRKSVIDTPMNSKFLQTLNTNQSQDKNMSSKLIQTLNSPKKFNPIQNLYEMHQKKNDNSINLNASLQRVDSKQNMHVPTENQETVEVTSPKQEPFTFNFDNNPKQTKFDELKQIKKKDKQLSNIQQFLNTSTPKSSIKQSESLRSLKLPSALSPFACQTSQTLTKQLTLPKCDNNKSGQHQNNQFNLNSPLSPQTSAQSFFHNNNSSTNMSQFQTFKKMSDRKVISKFEQQLYLNNNNNSCSAVVYKQGNHV